MNDLDERLTDLLTRSAAAVTVQPDLDAVIDDDEVVIDLDGRRPRQAVLALAAAGLLVVAALAGLALARSGDDGTEGVTDAPAASTERFPVFGHLPVELADAHVEATNGDGTHHVSVGQTWRPDAPTVRAAIGRVADDGTITDVVQLTAGPETGRWPIPPADQVEDLGGGYELAVGSGLILVRGPGAVVEVLGPPTAEALVRSIAGTAMTARLGPDGRPVLELGDLPDGYTVIAGPVPPEPDEQQAEIATPSSPPCAADSVSSCVMESATVVLETGVGAPELAILAPDVATPVDIGDGRGLVSTNEGDPTITRVAWTDPSGVTLSLWAMFDQDEALAIARGVALVDEASWRDAYPEWPDGVTASTIAGSVTTSIPEGDSILGQPAPTIRGSFTHVEAFTPPQEQGEWTILTIGATWCVPCADQIAVVSEYVDEHPEGPGLPVTLVVVDEEQSGTGGVDLWVEERGIDWPVLMIAEDQLPEWGAEGLPHLVIIDPEGIVRAVDTGSVDADGLAEMLPEG